MFPRKEFHEDVKNVEKERSGIRKALNVAGLIVGGVAALYAVDQFTGSKGIDLGAKPAGTSEPEKVPPTTLTEKVDISPKVLTRLNKFRRRDLFKFILDYKATKESGIVVRYLKESGITETAELESMRRKATKIMAEKYAYSFWQDFEKIPRELLTSKTIEIAAAEKNIYGFWLHFEEIPKKLLTSKIIKIEAERNASGARRFWSNFKEIPKELLTSKIIKIAAKGSADGFWSNFKEIPKELLTSKTIENATEEYLSKFWSNFKEIPRELLTSKIIENVAEISAHRFWWNFGIIPKEFLTSKVVEIAAAGNTSGFWQKFDGIPKEFLTSKTIENAAVEKCTYGYGIHRKEFWSNFKEIPKELLTPEIIKIAAERDNLGFTRNYKTIKELGIIEIAELESMEGALIETEEVDLSPEVLTRLNEFTKEELFRFVINDYHTIKKSGITETAELESMMREAIKIMAEKYAYNKDGWEFWRNFERIPKKFLTSEIIKIATEKYTQGGRIGKVDFWSNFREIPKKLLTPEIIKIAAAKDVREFWLKFERIPKEFLTPEIIKIAAVEDVYSFWSNFKKIPKEFLTPEIIKIAAEKYPRDFIGKYKAIEELGIVDPAELKKMGREAMGGF